MGIADDLERLAALHRSGSLTDAEFASAKARVLDPSPAAPLNGLGSALRSLRRSLHDRWLGGVCGGLARATDLPSWLWRLVFVVLVLCGGSGVLFYGLMWILVPMEGAGAGLGTGSFRST